MSRPFRGSERRIVLAIGDATAVAAAVALALWTWSLTSGFPFNGTFLRVHAIWFVAVPLWFVLLVPTRTAAIALDLRQTASGIARAAAALLVVYLGAFFYAGGDRLPRLVALYILWDATLLVAGWRLAAHWSLTRALFARRVLVVGSGRPLAAVNQVLQHPTFRDAHVVGLATTGPAAEPTMAPVLGSSASVDEIAARLDITDLVVALDGTAGEIDDSLLKRLLRCQESGTHVVRFAQVYEDTLRRVPVEHVDTSWLLTDFFDVARSRHSSPLAKRFVDIVSACVIGVIGLLCSPAIVLAIMLEDGFPVLYRQERLGRGGRPFRMVKFRTMGVDAEPDGEPRWTTPDDPRVTRVGRWLRRTRLDELPNVLSVLGGDMSMVGPRPERAQFVEQLERDLPLYRARLTVAPGLTGWAQVNCAYGDSVDDAIVKLEYDLYYIKHQSFWFDALILLRTAGTMMRLSGQ